MAYQARRKALYTEDFELVEEDGTVVHTLHVALDPDSIVKKLSEKHVALVKALQAIQSLDAPSEEALEVARNAVADILEAVFGVKDAKTIVDFYNGRYIELMTEVIPFVTGVVIPAVRKLAQENKKQVMQSYNRKQRRQFWGK